MDPTILGRSIPTIILSSTGMVWSLSLLIGKRTHIFRNVLLFVTSVGLCFSHIIVINLATVYSRDVFDDGEFMVYYRLYLVATFFNYIEPSLLWCALIDVFRTSAPTHKSNPIRSYSNNLISIYIAYVYTIAMVVVAVILVFYLSPVDFSGFIISTSPVATSCFLTFGQWGFPILFLLQYHATSSKDHVSSFSTSLWVLFGLLTLITILNTLEQVLALIGSDVSISVWIDWVANSLFVSLAILYLCFTGPKWLVSRNRHIRLSWSEQFDEPENGLVGRGSMSRIRSVYGGRFDESEDLYSNKVQVNN
ncbi:hypothetical protein BX666DRAFT_1948677 [Dichotomocladium elegans]|nr:hypothetical protein BX666DRAFT_1948677 [Dichotomocladium elegans]